MSNGTENPPPSPDPGGVQTDPGGNSTYTVNCGDFCDSCDRQCKDCKENCQQGKPLCSGQGPQTNMLILTCWFDSRSADKALSREITFYGQRVDLAETQGLGDAFTHVVSIEGANLVKGPVCITTHVHGINPGTWKVTARIAGDEGTSLVPGRVVGRNRMVFNETLRPTGTAWLVKDGVPGLVRFAWLILVGLGVTIGLAIQLATLNHQLVGIGRALEISLVAIAAGSIGAKIWFALKHRRPWSKIVTAGMCVQGFLVGTALAMTAGLLFAQVPLGIFYDATAPGLFLGLAVGRIGCFFGGCCAGRPTRSPWGVWSSDGHLGTRRVPTQILESVACFAIGFADLFAEGRLALPGAIFVASWVLYTLCRETLLFPLRAESRECPRMHKGQKRVFIKNSPLNPFARPSDSCGVLHDPYRETTQ
jgi:phosphatidylglycerol:prolipoprotein diacylglycerol transferase